jgi:hypothetical protein
MLRIRSAFRLKKPLNRSSNLPTKRWAQPFSKRKLLHAARVMGPTLVALAFAGVAHAQGTMDFSGAQTLMGTFKTFLIYAAILTNHTTHLLQEGVHILLGRCNQELPVVLSHVLPQEVEAIFDMRDAGFLR